MSVPGGFNWVLGVSRGFRGVIGISEDFRSIPEGSKNVPGGFRSVPGVFKWFQGCIRRFQGIPVGFKGFPGVFRGSHWRSMGFKDFQRSIPRDSEVFLEFSRGLRSVSRGLMGALWSSRVSGPSKGCPNGFQRLSRSFTGIRRGFLGYQVVSEALRGSFEGLSEALKRFKRAFQWCSSSRGPQGILGGFIFIFSSASRCVADKALDHHFGDGVFDSRCGRLIF